MKKKKKKNRHFPIRLNTFRYTIVLHVSAYLDFDRGKGGIREEAIDHHRWHGNTEEEEEEEEEACAFLGKSRSVLNRPRRQVAANGQGAGEKHC